MSRSARSAHMARIRGDNLGPEGRMSLALAMHGLKVTRNDGSLPGKPDFVVSLHGQASTKLCVFVHGCFWHACPRHCRVPKTRTEWWFAKLDSNAVRDKRVVRKLRRLGFKTMVVWEHDVRTAEAAEQMADRILNKLLNTK